MRPFIVILGLLSSVALAVGQVRNASIGYEGELRVDVIEAGAPTMQYQLSADATAVYQCLAANYHCPAAVNKQELSATTLGLATLKAVTAVGATQGLISARVTAQPPGGSLLCGEGDPETDGSSAVLMSVRYSNIVLHNTTRGTHGPTTPTALSATFYTCP